MLERLVEQRKALTAASVELDVPVELHASHWVLAEKVIKVLQVYEEATREASGEDSTWTRTYSPQQQTLVFLFVSSDNIFNYYRCWCHDQ